MDPHGVSENMVLLKFKHTPNYNKIARLYMFKPQIKTKWYTNYRFWPTTILSIRHSIVTTHDSHQLFLDKHTLIPYDSHKLIVVCLWIFHSIHMWFLCDRHIDCQNLRNFAGLPTWQLIFALTLCAVYCLQWWPWRPWMRLKTEGLTPQFMVVCRKQIG